MNGHLTVTAIRAVTPSPQVHSSVTFGFETHPMTPALAVALGWLHGSQPVTSNEFCPLHCGEWIEYTQGEETYDQQVALHAEAFCNRPDPQLVPSQSRIQQVAGSRDIDPRVMALHRTASTALALHAAAISREISSWHAAEGDESDDDGI